MSFLVFKEDIKHGIAKCFDQQKTDNYYEYSFEHTALLLL